ncbi:MAG: hypothetical protein JW910_19075, partial [Anaerolineae bacterium]|nr:hypothetical protein [Anaerolineae bacterium]
DAPPQAVATTDEPQVTLADLPAAAVMSWQVQVMDAQGDSVRGPVWHFSTGAAVAEAAAMVDGAIRLPTPTLTARAADVAVAAASPGWDARVLLPLLLGGVVLEGGLVAGLMWWRRRARIRQGRMRFE